MQHAIDTSGLDALVRELDILIRARYPLISVTTFEEGRFRGLMAAVAQLERHKAKPLYLWSRPQGLRQVAGPGLGPTDSGPPIANTEDPFSVLEHIAEAEKGLFVLCDYGPYLAPFGQEEPQLVRRLGSWPGRSRPGR